MDVGNNQKRDDANNGTPIDVSSSNILRLDAGSRTPAQGKPRAQTRNIEDRSHIQDLNPAGYAENEWK